MDKPTKAYDDASTAYNNLCAASSDAYVAYFLASTAKSAYTAARATFDKAVAVLAAGDPAAAAAYDAAAAADLKAREIALPTYAARKAEDRNSA